MGFVLSKSLVNPNDTFGLIGYLVICFAILILIKKSCLSMDFNFFKENVKNFKKIHPCRSFRYMCVTTTGIVFKIEFLTPKNMDHHTNSLFL